MKEKTIGNFIASLRKAKGYTQSELADLLGVSNKTISSWETDNSSPDLSMIPALADIFDVSCDELIRGEKKSPIKEINEDNYNNKTQNIIKSKLNKFKQQYMTMFYVNLGIFFAFIALAIISIYLIPYNYTLSVVLIILGIISYISGIIIGLISYNNAYSKADSDDEAYNDYYKFILKKRLIINCLYSFFILSDFFCRIYNKKIVELDYINDEQKVILKKNTKRKNILEIIYGSLALIGGILVIVFTLIVPNAFISPYSHSKDSIENKLYTIYISTNNTEVVDKNNNITKVKLIQFASNNLEGNYVRTTIFVDINYVVELPRVLTFDFKIESIENNKLRQDKTVDGLYYDYSNDNKNVSISYAGQIVFVFERYETDNGDVYYWNNDLKMYEKGESYNLDGKLVTAYQLNNCDVSEEESKIISSYIVYLFVNLTIEIGIYWLLIRKKYN